MSYEYILGNLLEEPIRYQYTAYQGAVLLRDWYASRKAVLDEIGMGTLPEEISVADLQSSAGPDLPQQVDMRRLLWSLSDTLLKGDCLTGEQKAGLDRCVKSFEVRKRLYHFYSATFKPESETDYQDIALYTAFACVCAEAFAQYHDLRYLNALLKVNDTILSQWGSREELRALPNQERMAYALGKELDFVTDICKEKGLV